MNAAQQELVRTTFARLAVMPEVAGALFYERLFAANPSFRPLFKNDMRIQGVKLMTMLAMVVYNLPEPGQILPAIHDLAVRHVEYGVKLADYDSAAGSAALDPRTGAGGRLHARRPGGVDGLLRRTRRRDEGGGRRLTTISPLALNETSRWRSMRRPRSRFSRSLGSALRK